MVKCRKALELRLSRLARERLHDIARELGYASTARFLSDRLRSSESAGIARMLETQRALAEVLNEALDETGAWRTSLQGIHDDLRRQLSWESLDTNDAADRLSLALDRKDMEDGEQMACERDYGGLSRLTLARAARPLGIIARAWLQEAAAEMTAALEEPDEDALERLRTLWVWLERRWHEGVEMDVNLEAGAMPVAG
jgi:hypothetical protein